MTGSFYHRIKHYLLDLPLMVWILLGFFITFIFFFLKPIFFDPSQAMQFNKYILTITPIGDDFREIVSYSSDWIQTGAVPAILYPSFTLLFFTPFTFLGPETGYAIITLIILACYILITLILPKKINKSRDISSFAMLILVTGIFSYGLQFELERGQWNVIAIAFCLTAIYIFFNHPRYRWLAYLIFSISVQLKLFPAIFVFVLIEDWSDWKNNIKRVAGLGMLNLLALFIFGLNPILNTIRSTVGIKSFNSGRPFNLSITSFSIFLLSSNILPRKRIVLWLLANNWVLQLFFFAFLGFCFLIIFRQTYMKKLKGFNPYIFLACSIGACVIPSISFDYKLSMLPACIAISIPGILSFKKTENSLLNILLAFIFSLAYSSTLYSYTNKPEILQNDFPALLIILAICTVLSCMKPGTLSDPASIATINS